jgi:hypothetical protein
MVIKSSYYNLREMIYCYRETREEDMFYCNMTTATQRPNEETLESKHSLECFQAQVMISWWECCGKYLNIKYSQVLFQL